MPICIDCRKKQATKGDILCGECAVVNLAIEIAKKNGRALNDDQKIPAKKSNVFGADRDYHGFSE